MSNTQVGSNKNITTTSKRKRPRGCDVDIKKIKLNQKKRIKLNKLVNAQYIGVAFLLFSLFYSIIIFNESAYAVYPLHIFILRTVEGIILLSVLSLGVVILAISSILKMQIK